MTSDTRAVGAPGSGATSPRVLTRHVGRICDALRATALPGRSFTGRMTSYHMGWVDEHGQPADSAPGKLVRPALCLWATEACGGALAEALPVAAALEWIHNFTLVHDDIQDGDRERRNRPTVWAVWGAAQGINAGDALHALAFRTLGGDVVHPQRHLQAIRIVADAVLVVVDGQVLDLRLEGMPDTSVRTYLRMIRAKTAALIGASMESGAVVAGASVEIASTLRSAGVLLGTAFQIRDDWLGTWGDSAATGKSSSGDLGRCKLTYPVVAGYAVMNSQQRAQMRALFRDGPGDAGALRRLLLDAGGPELSRDAPRRFADKATGLVRGLPVPHHFIDDFTEVATYVASRSR